MSIKESIVNIRGQIKAAEHAYRRVPDSVQLLVVSKGRAISELQQAIIAGQKLFAESYLQEALAKIKVFSGQNLEWHFIGPIQSNKAKNIAQNFSWVHSVDRIKIAQYLSQYRPQGEPLLNICIQVNISGESTKAGVPLTEIASLAKKIVKLPGLQLRGLMAIPEPTSVFSQQCVPYLALQHALDSLNAQGFQLQTLSMGMSADYIAAIAHGATYVRLGSAIFGPKEG